MALYARISSHDQQTLPLQIKTMRGYAEHRGWQIAAEIKEVGSGALQRPKREELLAAIRRRELDAILAWRLDRWGRSLPDLVITLKELAELGTGFVSLTEAFDMTTQPAERSPGCWPRPAGVDRTGSLIGLRDWALIALMSYTFARVSAAVGMKVGDFYVQNRRGWVRLHEKGGKVTELPCHHNLDQFLEEWISAAGLTGEPDTALFLTLNHGRLSEACQALPQANVHIMIQRRAKAAGLRTKISARSFRATGITTYLKNGGRLEVAQAMAGHESARTTGLYDRRSDAVALDERIAF